MNETRNNEEMSEISAVDWFKQLPISDDDKKILFTLIKELVTSSQMVVSETILDIIFPSKDSPNKKQCLDIIHQWISNYTTTTIDGLYQSVTKKEG